MNKIKRAFMAEEYKLIDGVKACEHNDLEEYEDDPETLAEQAETIRDGLREDGINV